MPAAIPKPVINRLIAALPPKDQRRILARCDIVGLRVGAVLCEPDQRYSHVYFPLTGFIALVAAAEGHPPLEIALIGNEGMLGATMALGIHAAPLKGIIQGSGHALRLSASQFRQEIVASAAFKTTLHQYLYVMMAQLSQSAVCTRFHEVDARLARWLLETHDRAHSCSFRLTHSVLADMLGVRRSAITIAAGGLQRRKLIRYTRGLIRILDRKGLEAASCECHEQARQDYARLFCHD